MKKDVEKVKITQKKCKYCDKCYRDEYKINICNPCLAEIKKNVRNK